MESKLLERSIWINAPRERVWLAVTEPHQIAAWFAPGTDFTIKDETISILMGGQYIEVAFIKTFDPPRELTTLNLPERSIATSYLLAEENGGTRFTVVENGLESLSAEARQQHIEQDSAGWEKALQNLDAYINGQELPTPQGF